MKLGRINYPISPGSNSRIARFLNIFFSLKVNELCECNIKYTSASKRVTKNKHSKIYKIALAAKDLVQRFSKTSFKNVILNIFKSFLYITLDFYTLIRNKI
jgi:hypothetical protein